MRKILFCFLFLAFCHVAQAQLSCTNCNTVRTTWGRGSAPPSRDFWWWHEPVDPPDHGITSVLSINSNHWATLLDTPDKLLYNIILTGDSEFRILGSGQYTADARIIQDRRTSSLTLSAPNAGNWGGQNAGLILSGDQGWTITGNMWHENYETLLKKHWVWNLRGVSEAGGANSYGGATTINGGYIACNKRSGTVAIPGDIILKTTPGGSESGLWFLQDNQVNRTGVLTFNTSAGVNALVRLNGTSQTLAGINATSGNAHFTNIERNDPYIANIPHNTGKAFLTLTGNGSYVIGNGAFFQGGKGELVVRVEGGGQAISNPTSDIRDVSFVTSGRLELRADGSYSTDPTASFTGTGTHFKTGTGELMVYNLRPVGNVEVRGGILNLKGTSNLGNGAPYNSTLSISGGAILDHGNAETIRLNGEIAGTGILRRSAMGNGNTLITGNKKSFSGTVIATGAGFLGGTSDVSNGFSIVESGGSIGGLWAEDRSGGTFIVSNLSFKTTNSRLRVTARSPDDNTPSLLEVRARTTSSPGRVVANNGFTVDVPSPKINNGYILKCENGVSSRLPLPVTGVNNTGKTLYFRWDGIGLYMITQGLICDNCTFQAGGATVTGTPDSPAPILGEPGEFSGDITLNGDCRFTILGKGNYTLSGQINGTGPLTFKAPDANLEGLDAGFTLSGLTPNNYSGSASIKNGYVICHKGAGITAVPNSILVSGQGTLAHIWCLSDGQFGSGAVIDFSGANNKSYMHLNGTSQTVAGIQADTPAAVVDNSEAALFPSGTAAQLSPLAGTLNIAGGANAYVFGGGGAIRRGTDSSPALTVNVASGAQIIQDPGENINHVTLSSARDAVLEFKTSPIPIPIPNPPPSNVYSVGSGVVFKGLGDVKKTGDGTIGTNNSVISTQGRIWVAEGTLRNRGDNNVYDNNTAVLQVDAPRGNHHTVFDLGGNASVFDGLTGNGIVQSSEWAATLNPQAGAGYSLLTLGQGGSRDNPVFDGVIRDNASTTIEAGAAAGGIALKKVGAGTQVLKGANLYTGPTAVSAGTLKLEGNAQLGTTSAGNVYGGVLEISNAPEGTSAVFEHHGDQTQIFNGNITNHLGVGALGTFLQSGRGSSIINGVRIKDFGGNVTIEAGFFGGTADLRNTRNVNVYANGRLGGGLGTPSHGGVLTVSGLNFAARSTLTVTASSVDNTPSLVIVKRQGTNEPGAISADANFNVEILDTDISDGYLIKCNNGLSSNLQIPVITVNNTGKNVRLTWDNQGLLMKIIVGEIILTVSPVCPKGITPGNPSVTVDALYVHPEKRPPPGSPVRFWLSDERAKTGEIEVSWAGDNIVRAVFSGANPANVPLPFTVFYDDKENEPLSVLSSINPQPALRLTSGSNTVCLGASAALQASGTGTVTISAQDAATASIWALPDLTATATLSAAGNVNLLATDGGGCRSEYLAIVVRPNPVISPKEGDLTKLCSGGSYELLTSGTPDPADKWFIKDSGNNSIGSTAVTANGKNTFTAGNVNSGDAVVQEISFQSGGCASNVLQATVNPKPLVTMPFDNFNLCGGSEQPAITPGTGNGLQAATGYQWSQSGPHADDVGLANRADWSPSIPPFVAPAVTRNLTRSMVITPYNSQTACTGDVVNWRITIRPKAEISAGNVDVSKLCSGSRVPLTQNLSQGEWMVNDVNSSANSIETAIILISGKPPDLQSGRVLGAAVTQEVRFKSGNCTSEPLVITVNPSPTISPKNESLDLTKLCSGGVYNDIFTVSNVASAASGSWVINNADPANNSITETVVSTGDNGAINLRAGTLVNSDNAVVQEIRFQYGTGVCASPTLRIAINPRPTVTMPFDNFILCAGNTQSAITPVTGAGLRAATGYQWRQNGPRADDVGLANRADWSPAVSSFTAPPATDDLTRELIRNMVITPYNSQTACTGDDVNWNITIRSSARISTGDVDVSKLCSGTPVPITQNLSQGEWTINDANSLTNSIQTGVITGTGETASLLPGKVTNGNAVVQEVSFKSGNCKSNVIIITVNPSPTVSLKEGVDAAKLCSGGVYNSILSAINLAVSDPGQWVINDAVLTNNTDNAIGTAVTAETNGNYSLTAGSVSSDLAAVQKISFLSSGCASVPITVTISPKPTVNMTSVSICSGAEQPSVTPVTGLNLQAATGYKWQQSGASADEVGLPNSADWATAIPLFKAPAATHVLTRNMVITPYNSVSACTGDPQPWSIAVNPVPVISAARDLSRLCAGTLYANAFAMSVPVSGGSWAVYNVGTSDLNTISTAVNNSSAEGKGDLSTGNPLGITVQDVAFISPAPASCKSNVLGITVIPLLLGDANGNLPALEYCNGEVVQAWTPPSSGTGITKPTAFKWEAWGTNSAYIGLPYYNSDWTKPAISGFTAKNETENMISCGLMVYAYNATSGCTVSKTMTVNVQPTPKIAVSRGVNLAKLCAGLSYPNAISVISKGTGGEWRVFDAGKNIPSRIQSTVAGNNERGSLTVGNALKKTAEEVVYKSHGCFSARLAITVYPKPTMNKIPDMAYCANSNILSFVPKSRGKDEAKTTNYQWKMPVGAANSGNVGLPDHTGDWTREALPGFQSNAAGVKRDISITGYNNVSGCTADPQVFTLSLNSTLTLTFESAPAVCNGTETNILLHSSLSNAVYSWTADDNHAGARSQTERVESPTIKQRLSVNGNASETVTYRVRAFSSNCTSEEVPISVAVSPEQGLKPEVAGGGKYCAGAENNDYQTELIPSVPSATGTEWTYISYHGDAEGNAEDDIGGNTQQWTKGPLPAVNAVKDRLVLFGGEAAAVRYVFRAFSPDGCLGAPSDPTEVKLFPSLEKQEIEMDAAPSVCSRSATRPAAVGIVTLRSLESDVSYTWTTDRTNAPDVSGYTEPSRDGAVASVNNPAAAMPAISDPLSLPSTATAAQTLTYSITPWHLGCPGKTILAQVQVNPLPAVTPPANRQHCSGTEAPAEPLTGTHGANSFKWSGGGLAGLADQTEYGAGLPGYTVPAATEPIGPLQVTLLAKNSYGCESPPASFTISAGPKPSIVLNSSRPLCSGPTLGNGRRRQNRHCLQCARRKIRVESGGRRQYRRRQQPRGNCQSQRTYDIPGRRKYGAGRRVHQKDNRL